MVRGAFGMGQSRHVMWYIAPKVRLQSTRASACPLYTIWNRLVKAQSNKGDKVLEDVAGTFYALLNVANGSLHYVCVHT